MNPETVKRLKADVPELRELITFLRLEVHKLNTLEGIEISNRNAVEDIALETMARIRAHQVLTTILEPLIGSSADVAGINPQEYVA